MGIRVYAKSLTWGGGQLELRRRALPCDGVRDAALDPVPRGVAPSEPNRTGTMFQGEKVRGDATNSQVCSLRFDVFHESFQLCLNLVYLCLQYRL